MIKFHQFTLEEFYHDRTRKKTLYACVNALMLLLNEDAKTQAYAEQHEETPKQKKSASGLIQIGSETKTQEPRIIAIQPKGSKEEEAVGATQFYSEKEIKMCPKLKDGKFRRTKDGYWQVRYRKNGQNVQFTNKEKKIVVSRFREWCFSQKDEVKKKCNKTNQNFSDFMEIFFRDIKIQTVEKETRDNLYKQAKKHILPVLGAHKIKTITPLNCQSVMAPILERGQGRTAETISQLLNEIFRAAVGEHLIKENPMNYVKVPKHERECGVSLTREEIAAFIRDCSTSTYYRIFMLMLYTGIRRCEFKSLQFEENFISVQNGKKRKGQKVKFRRIPIAPGLRKFLPLSDKELAVKDDVLTKHFKRICPKHTLKDLRHTFTTVTQECGISKELVDVWTAHVKKADMTASVYTHFSNEYCLREIQKLVY